MKRTDRLKALDAVGGCSFCRACGKPEDYLDSGPYGPDYYVYCYGDCPELLLRKPRRALTWEYIEWLEREVRLYEKPSRAG